MKALVISGETLTESPWDIEGILSKVPQPSNKDVLEKVDFQEKYWKKQENLYKHAMSLMNR